MGIFLDVLVVLVFGLSVFLGWKNGLIKSLTGLISFAVAIAVASWLSTPVANWVFDSAVAPAITASIVDAQDEATQSAIQSADEMLAELPDGVRTLLTSVGIDIDETLADQIQADSVGTLAERLVSDVFKPMIISVFRVVAMLLLFVVTSLIMSVIMWVVDKAFKLPMLREANRVLGVIPGAINGVLGMMLAVTVMQLLCSLDVLITPEAIQSSSIVSWINSINPFALKLG